MDSRGRRVADAVMVGLATVLVRVFFRRVEVEGADQMPCDRPVVLVANHLNGLVDPLLIMTALRRYPRFVGKSTLFRIPLLWPFLRLAGVVPVVRASDGVSADHNEGAFVKCRAMLAHRGVVALFPEGISHDRSELQPMRTGAARIALGAAFDDHTPGVMVLAVGMAYDSKARFRSRALVRVGTPSEIDARKREYQRDPHGCVREVTEELARGLRAVSPSYTSWEQAAGLARMAEVACRPVGRASSVEVDLADRECLAQSLAAAEASEEGARRVAAARVAFDAYERRLALLGLSDCRVTASTSGGPARMWRAVIWWLMRLVVASPIALLGAVIHVVPYQVVKRLAARPSNEAVKATVKVVGCFTLFALTYVGLALAVGRREGVLTGVAVFLGAPLCGYVAVRLAELARDGGGVLEGYHLVGHHAARDRRPLLTPLLADRAELVRLVRAASCAASSTTG